MTQENHNSRKNIIIVSVVYFILFLAIFRDILRIEGTAVTFFRMSLPIAIVIIFIFPKFAKQFLLICASLLIVTIFQYFIFYKIIRPDLSLDLNNAFKYFVLYICIIIIFFLVKVIKCISGENFQKSMLRFILITGVILTILAAIACYDYDFFGGLIPDNMNNYGCYIAAFIPFLLIGMHYKSKFYGIIILFCMAILYINDSKAVIFGIAVQFVIFLCIAKKTDTKLKFFLYRYLVLLIAMIAIIYIVLLNPKINGYPLKETIFEPIIRIFTNNPYPTYQASVSFRTNTTLYALIMLFKSGFIGLGMGNTGILLKNEFPNINPEYTQAASSSVLNLHNAWLEFTLDIGLIGIIIIWFAIKYVFKLYFTKSNLSQTEKLKTIFIVSFPIWVLSASGIYTQYYLMIIISYFMYIKNDIFREKEKMK